MKEPEYEVVLLTEDVLTGTDSCPNYCPTDCLSKSGDCDLDCDFDPDTCDCESKAGKIAAPKKPNNPLGDFTNTFF